MDYTDRLIDAAVSNYAPDKSIKKRIFDKIMSKSCKKNTDSSNITVVYVSSDAEKILQKIFSKTNKIFRKLSKMENEVFKESGVYEYM